MDDQSAFEKKITTDQLKLGMYVSQLDRPWMDTPFLLQGFPLIDETEIAQLQELCEFVFIDVERGDDVLAPKLDTAPLQASAAAGNTIHTKAELPTARKHVNSVASEIALVFDTAKAGGEIQVTELRSKIFGLVDSALRNADASMLLARLRAKDNYTYNHVLCVAVMAVALGKRLGLDREELQTLALAASLFDVGKMHVPEGLLNQSAQLSAEDRIQIRKHVDHGMETLRKLDVDYQVLDVAQYHHERHDGSGYPLGRGGEDISLFAQIVGLVDTYDAMISHRVYRAAMSHERAVHELYNQRGKAFQADMLEQFIQCLGTYPVGSIVELSNGDIGIVVQQNGLRRLRPQVMLVLDKDHKPLDLFPIVDLMNEMGGSNEQPLSIKHTLEPGAFGIDPSEYFL